jgi:hypothetical protein
MSNRLGRCCTNRLMAASTSLRKEGLVRGQSLPDPLPGGSEQVAPCGGVGVGLPGDGAGVGVDGGGVGAGFSGVGMGTGTTTTGTGTTFTGLGLSGRSSVMVLHPTARPMSSATRQDRGIRMAGSLSEN